VATATLYFPAAVGRERVSAAAVRGRGHHLMHSLLGEEKMELVRRIEGLPRGSQQRKAIFYEMHGRLARARLDNPALRQWEREVRDAEEREREEGALFDRELFFALQPRERLEGLVRRCEEAIGGS
jgi:hypothetical protein